MIITKEFLPSNTRNSTFLQICMCICLSIHTQTFTDNNKGCHLCNGAMNTFTKLLQEKIEDRFII